MAELHGLQKGGDPNHSIAGMILQVYKVFFLIEGLRNPNIWLFSRKCVGQ